MVDANGRCSLTSRQLAYKQQQVEDHLRRIGHLQFPALPPILGAAKTRHYRNKLEFTFSNKAYLTDEEIREAGEDWPRRNALGFHIPKLFDKVLDIQTCYLQEEPANLIKNTIRDWAEKHKLSFYDIRQPGRLAA